jgi:hypothetical protein
VHSTSEKHGEKKKARKSYPQETNNSIEDLVGNEENEYPVPNPNKAMMNITNELNDTHKNNLSKRKL